MFLNGDCRHLQADAEMLAGPPHGALRKCHSAGGGNRFQAGGDVAHIPDTFSSSSHHIAHVDAQGGIALPYARMWLFRSPISADRDGTWLPRHASEPPQDTVRRCSSHAALP